MLNCSIKELRIIRAGIYGLRKKGQRTREEPDKGRCLVFSWTTLSIEKIEPQTKYSTDKTSPVVLLSKEKIEP